MPKADNNEEQRATSIEPWDLSGDRDFLEYGQRHGILEQERNLSGLKRICFCYGYTERRCKDFLPCFILLMYMIIYLIGYYSGYKSQCICNTTINV